jgi:hypothetical protein
VKKILSHLGLRTEPLSRARARDPTGQESFDESAASTRAVSGGNAHTAARTGELRPAPRLRGGGSREARRLSPEPRRDGDAVSGRPRESATVS